MHMKLASNGAPTFPNAKEESPLDLGWQIEHQTDGTTWLSGSLPDQAALHGILLTDRLARSRAPLA